MAEKDLTDEDIGGAGANDPADVAAWAARHSGGGADGADGGGDRHPDGSDIRGPFHDQ